MTSEEQHGEEDNRQFKAAQEAFAQAFADAVMKSLQPHIDELVAIVKKAIRPYLPYHRAKFQRHPKRRALRK